MIRAIRYRDQREFRQGASAGAVYFDLIGEETAMWFRCPCGCGDFSRIRVGRDAKPAQSPSWNWNGSLNEPTLVPSVNQLKCGWHGWLRDGYWESV